jgi:glycerol-3-phosphate acyltransferase PlsY
MMSFHLPTSYALTGREFTWIVASYLIGCFTAGFYWTRWKTGQDIRQLGSGNVGARNVGRILGAGGFTITLLLDLCKGAAAVFIGQWLELRSEALVATVVAVLVGHNWPIQLRFQGGKGIAVSMGALLVYDPFLVLCLIALFVPLYLLIWNFTLAGMLSYTLGPAVLFLRGDDKVDIAALSIVATLVVIAHRRNIREEIARFIGHRPVKGAPASMHKGPNEEV